MIRRIFHWDLVKQIMIKKRIEICKPKCYHIIPPFFRVLDVVILGSIRCFRVLCVITDEKRRREYFSKRRLGLILNLLTT